MLSPPIRFLAPFGVGWFIDYTDSKDFKLDFLIELVDQS